MKQICSYDHLCVRSRHFPSCLLFNRDTEIEIWKLYHSSQIFTGYFLYVPQWHYFLFWKKIIFFFINLSLDSWFLPKPKKNFNPYCPFHHNLAVKWLKLKLAVLPAQLTDTQAECQFSFRDFRSLGSNPVLLWWDDSIYRLLFLCSNDN